MGPRYVGNYTFEVDRLSFEETKYIKAECTHFTVIELTEQLINRGFAIRAESVAMHVITYDETKWWTVKRSEYMRRFEAMYSIKTVGKQVGTIPEVFFKPFICWAIENGYEYYQVAEVLERAPSTIRMWANGYGYKEYTRVTTKTPDMNGKKNRTETLRDLSVLGTPQEFDFNQVSIDKSTHSIKIPREIGQKILKEEQDRLQGQGEQDRRLGASVRHTIERFEALGYDATITLTKIHVTVKEVEMKVAL